MTLRLVLTGSVISVALLASDNSPALSAFADAGKSLQELARESVDREIVTSLRGRRGPEVASPLVSGGRPLVRLPQRARSETCSIPLLESKIQHPERFRMKVLKLPAMRADNIGVPSPAPACNGWN